MKPRTSGSRLLETVRFGLTILAVCASLPVGATESSPPIPVILDTDGHADYDDIVNVMLCAALPEIDLLGVVVTVAATEENARTVAKALKVMGREDVGVYIGEQSGSEEPDFTYMGQFPQRRIREWPTLEAWAAKFEVPPQPRTGVEFYLDSILDSDDRVVVITTGPLSTLGAAFQAADATGVSDRFVGGIDRILVSGWDFETVEYNVYKDVQAARRVFESGASIYQFGGEAHDPVYLGHELRQTWWRAQTPATWALQDVYRLWRAGWDPRSPFVPILHDTVPTAYLIEGDEVCRLEPMPVGQDSVGRLVHTTGPDTLHVRVESDPIRLAEFVAERLRSGIVPARWHLRLALEGSTGLPPEVRSHIDSLLERLPEGAEPVSPELEPLFRSLESSLVSAGESGREVARHAGAAREFLFGAPRDDAWRDPYTDTYLAIYVPLLKIYTGVSKNKLAAAGAVGVVLVGLGLYFRHRRRRRGGTPRD
jgi:inosine-uridine nucleoside N-ribohydrolase